MNITSDLAKGLTSMSEVRQVKVLIIPTSEIDDAMGYCKNADSLLEELRTLQAGFSNAQQLLQEGDSCTAVDILLKMTKEQPRSNRAKSIFSDAVKLQNEIMILCAEKMAEKGNFQRARTMLQPYANENEPFQKTLEKIADRQNREMNEKVRQRKEIMEDIKKDDRRWSVIGMLAGVLSGLMLLVGVGAALLGQLSTAIVSALSSIIPGFVVVLYYNRSDKIRAERLRLIDKTSSEELLENEVIRKVTGLSNARLDE